ncbi:MAG: ABC transporter ATP-binding protein/permease [Acidimicrobiia bacterium]|nr:ABC transporter ATP-binding protein/permease [Acidimicrobiia bacterium]
MAGWMAGGVSEEDALDLAETGRVLRRTGRMLLPYRRRGAGAVGLLVAWTLALLAGPVLVRTAIDSGIQVDDSGVVNRAVAGYVVAALVAYVTYRFGILNLARVGENLLRDLRNRVFAHLLRQPMSFYDRNKAGVLVSRMTSDIDSLAELVQYGLLMFISATLLVSLSIALLFVLSWQLTLVLLVVVPLLVPASIKFKRASNDAYLVVRDEIAGTLSSLQEGFSGVRVVQAFAREDVEAGRFAETNNRLYRSHMQSVKIASWYLPIVDFAGVFTTALAVGVGGLMVRSGQMSLGTVAAFVLLLSNLFEPVQTLSQLFNMLQSGTASLAKLFDVLDTPVGLDERADAKELPAAGALVVDDVSFAYDDEGPVVLSSVSLEVADGERLALVGPTGAGKSTLAKLMARLYDPTSGSVLFGGMDLRDATMASLRERIVVVPQEGFLFAGTVADNIRVARSDATDDDVEAALRRIGAWDRIVALPEGMHTVVRERGSRLSAGERQLVSLARAAMVDPAVLVLDEATSSLDPGTEVLVESAMELLMKGRTVIVIAHRLTTSERSDRVGVVDGGRLVELGTHDELVDAGGTYGGLYEAWERGLSATGR